MKILLEVPDDFTLEEGDAFDAVQSALDHFSIPASMTLVPPAAGQSEDCGRGALT